MLIQAINSYQNFFQCPSLLESGKNNVFLPKVSEKMGFLCSLITEGKKQKKRSNEFDNDNFPKDRYWQCGNCNRYNLKNVWRCAYCGNSR